MSAPIMAAVQDVENAGIRWGVNIAKGVEPNDAEVARVRGALFAAIETDHLARLVVAAERIAAALERANDLDPMTAIQEALGQAPQAGDPDDIRPPDWMLR